MKRTLEELSSNVPTFTTKIINNNQQNCLSITINGNEMVEREGEWK